MLNVGLLVIRIMLGLIFIAHGSQKLFGWFGGKGLHGTVAMMEKMGMRPAPFWGLTAGLAEFGGGGLILLGFLTPLGSLGIIAAMLVAIIQVHWAKGFWNTKGGIEFPLMNLSAALGLALTGPGAYSLDAAMHTGLPEPAAILIGLGLVVAGVLISRATRSHPTAQTA